MKKTVYVGFKFPHMGPHAGYDQIRRYGHYDLLIDCQLDYTRWQRLAAKGGILWRLHNRFFGGYMWSVELRCLWLALRRRNLVFHFIYAENTYRFLGFFKWLGFRVVCTYHQPASFFREFPAYVVGLQLIDHVIVLSEDAQEVFSPALGPDRVHFIPHGVDCEFFMPRGEAPQKMELLMVGNWMRNFKFASALFDRLLSAIPELSIHVVALKENHRYFNIHSRLNLHCGISDDDLVARYQSASLLFLPLDGYVANNAVLEMSAVGGSILIASDQAPEDDLRILVEYVELDIQAANSRILEMLNRNESSALIKRRLVVESYSWPVVGAKTKKVLAS